MQIPAIAPNPLRFGMRTARNVQPCIMVIFGATGDLTHRKLIPALYNLALEQPLPPQFTVVGVARRAFSDEQFRQQALESVNNFSRRSPASPAVWETFSKGFFYHQLQFDNPDDYQSLAERLKQLDAERGTQSNYIYYLATPPSFYPTIANNLSAGGLGGHNNSGEQGWSRIIVEKPFGHNLESALALNHELNKAFSEQQIYRIDHYLGKETVQNIMVLRFANGIFEPIWNRRYIDNVQITVAETLGVGGRVDYYEEAGALRDMVQNHMMQLLTLVAMEPPVNFDADAVRDEKVKVLRAITPYAEGEVASDTLRGQYGPGMIGGEKVLGYREEPGVKANSPTETYTALKLFIENWRWAGVPFYLRHGKRLTKRITEIAIQFNRPPYLLFQGTGADQMQPNVLSLRIQPNEGISLLFDAKVPGQEMQLRSVNMDFLYGSSFGVEPPEAYERLLLECMLGDSTLFTRIDETEYSWRLIDAIERGWAKMPASALHQYEPGTWGPKEAATLIERDGRTWRHL
ncbi:MAG: Glucose-6-phosphate 1-dehydrogenase [Ktedonobacterales bacterium]|jgi:glucose-6-phosphate 1-dehydrogenase|nr:MAG: Glucose-6-phosphate 1-dehydrogenase [Ktedonobacterales bacterium]